MPNPENHKSSQTAQCPKPEAPIEPAPVPEGPTPLPEGSYKTSLQVSGYDWVTLVAIPCLAVIACFAMWAGYGGVAATCAGAVAGITTRLFG